MNKSFEQLHKTLDDCFRQILGKEQESIDRAANLMVESIKRDELIHVIGTGGHSNMGTYEMFCRAGCLAAVNALLDPNTLLSSGAMRSIAMERTPGLARVELDAFNVTSGVLIICNAYGINALTIDSALVVKGRGVPTIGVTSKSYADHVPAGHPARHPSGKNLYQSVDVFVNCHMPLNDAVVEFEDFLAPGHRQRQHLRPTVRHPGGIEEVVRLRRLVFQ